MAKPSRNRVKGQIKFWQRRKIRDNSNLESAMQIPAMFSSVNVPFVIPIVAIIMSLSIPIVALITEYSKRRKLYELHHQERLAAIEKGLELPPRPPDLAGGVAAKAPRYLLKGLIWLLIGIAVFLAVGVNDSWATAMFGLIPAAIGAAYLIYAVTQK
jgi:hypothetical protein